MSEDEDRCYNSLWEAAQSVEDAGIWLSGLENTGLGTILNQTTTKDVVFVVKDAGIVSCDLSNVLNTTGITKVECANQFRIWASSLNDNRNGESPLLMYHWLSNQTKSSLEVGETYSTLLEEVAKIEDNSFDSPQTTRISLQDDRTISLPEGIAPVEGEFGGYQNATIIDERVLCDPSGGTVYVVDRPLWPVGMPRANTTSVPQLENFCSTSIHSILRENNGFQVPAQVALGSYLYPLLDSLLSPRTNITIFFPTIQETPLLDQAITGLTARESYMATYVLMMMLQGGKCPENFRNGLTASTLLGDNSDAEVSMRIEPDDDNPNEFGVTLMLGNETGSAQYRAIYLGNACHSTVYRLEALVVPYDNVDKSRANIVLPVDNVDVVPQVSFEDSFNVGDICSNGGGYNALNNPSMEGSENSSSSISGGALAGIIVGVCVCIALLMVVVWWFCRRRFRSGSEEKKVFACPGEGQQQYNKTVSSTSSDEEKSMDQSDVVLKESDVVFDIDPKTGQPLELGRGRFGQVYQGCLLGVEKVAIKCITDDSAFSILRVPSGNTSSRKSVSSSKEVDDTSLETPHSEQGDSHVSNDQIYKEISVLKSCRSQHIVSFMGAVLLPKEVRLITELMPAGNLWTALGHGTGSRKVTWYHGGIFIAMDVAAGLKYLHEKRRVIHLDLKSSNILLREEQRNGGGSRYDGMYQAKISDVGLSKILPMSREYLSSLEAGGTWNWCAPEVILNYKCTPAADIYSYGVVLWEICTGEIPVRGCMRDVRVPEECPQEISDLIHACIDWNEQSPVRERPKASKAYDIIESLLRNHT